MYWILVDKPEAKYCTGGGGMYVGGHDFIKKYGPMLGSNEPLSIKFPGYIVKELDAPVRRQPVRVPADYFKCSCESIVSDRLRQLLLENGSKAEFYPVTFNEKKIKCVDSYYYMRVLPRIACMDRKQSKYEIEYLESGYESVDDITRLVIDETIIEKNIMMLRMDELPIILVHDKLKQVIDKEAITGIFFIKPEQYPDSVRLWSEQYDQAKKSQ